MDRLKAIMCNSMQDFFVYLHSNMDRLKDTEVSPSAETLKNLHSNMDRLKECMWLWLKISSKTFTFQYG